MPFVFATFNTMWLFDNEEPLKRWGLRLPSGGLAEKIELVAKAIMSIGPEGGHGPDIIALQEVEGQVTLGPLLAKLQELGSPLKHIYCSDTLDPFTGQNVAVLSATPASILPVTRLDQTAVAYVDAGEREKMGSLGKFLRVDIEIDNTVLTIFNCHLKSRRGGTEQTRLLRNVQAQIMRDLSRPRVEQGSMRQPSFTLICGDFNDEPRSQPINIMAGKLDTSYNLISATTELPVDEQHTYTYDGKNQQLDHILLSKFTHDRMTEAGFTRVDEETSDHDAVWCALDLTLPPPA
ncbi:endonuclease/exonuclease/phosphatase family protein [Pacificoceanicola onchidii]|uniref:endonuclease/exonuclease/phosphatase family protein n=1 Tax=Pacificoceanicola onchidii TaxID=2562685 RepID=UPI0010A5E058|nr:endonuclease/exonuclease/phosphatase family protein [Pacificoceanicola onchidii]